MKYIELYLLVLLIGISLFMASCGQTGDLYLPGDEPGSKKEKTKN
jgi:predicted small lipoprotein YifL